MSTSIVPLDLQTLDLASTLRTVPLNGSPSSVDYNDTAREFLTDLATLVGFINDTLLPILNTLPSTAATGLYGSTLQVSDDATNPLFFSTAENTFLTVSEVLIGLNAAIKALQLLCANLNAQIIQLSTKLSTTNQTDMLATVQALSDQYRSIYSCWFALKPTSAKFAFPGRELGFEGPRNYKFAP
jgi:hypothetical protein